MYKNSPFYRRNSTPSGLSLATYKHSMILRRSPPPTRQTYARWWGGVWRREKNPTLKSLQFRKRRLRASMRPAERQVFLSVFRLQSPITDRGFVFTGEFLARNYWAAGLDREILWPTCGIQAVPW